MSDAEPSPRRPRPVQAEALDRIVGRLSRAEEAPWLHAEVARRMAGRLALIRLHPRRVIDWCSFTGASRSLLGQAYPQAQLIRVETDAMRLQEAASPSALRWWSPRRWAGAAASAVAPQQVEDGSADLLWANMMLHLVQDPQALLQRWQRALAVDGFLMFSTLGPGSLQGLAQLYARCGWPPPHAPFVDMHDLGDMLVHAGFDDPVMDQEPLTLTWPDAPSLLRELRSLGGNADPGRQRGLRTPRWQRRLCEALQQLQGPDGRLRLDFELVYGHAVRAAPRPRVAQSTSVPLDEMRAMVRAGRRTPGSGRGLG